MSTIYYTTQGLILKKTPWGEADYMVRLLTDEFGKIDMIARGARRASAKLNSHLDIGNCIRSAFIKNGDRLPTIIDAEVVDNHHDWFSDPISLDYALRIIKTVDGLVPIGVGERELYQLVVQFFSEHHTDLLQERAQKFLDELFAHEGYGSTRHIDALPTDIHEAIIGTWPALKI